MLQRYIYSYEKTIQLAQRHLTKGRIDFAILCYNQAIAIDPERYEAYLSLAKIYHTKKKYENNKQAIYYFELSLKYIPEFDSVLKEEIEQRIQAIKIIKRLHTAIADYDSQYGPEGNMSNPLGLEDSEPIGDTSPEIEEDIENTNEKIIESSLSLETSATAFKNELNSGQVKEILRIPDYTTGNNFHDNERETAMQRNEEKIKEIEKHSINLMWLHKDQTKEGENLFTSGNQREQQDDLERRRELEDDEEKKNQLVVDPQKENYQQSQLIKWCKANPEAEVYFWYDGAKTTEQAIRLTAQSLGEYKDKIKLRDIRQLSVVQKFPDLFSEKVPLYFRIDILKLIICLDSLEQNKMDAALFSDFSIGDKQAEALGKAALFDERMEMLSKYGLLLGHDGQSVENQFIQTYNTPLLIEALKHAINCSLLIAKNTLNEAQKNGSALNIQELESIPFKAAHLYIYIYMLSKIKNQPIKIRADIVDKNESPNEWVDYDPTKHGYKIFGTFLTVNANGVGSHQYFDDETEKVHLLKDVIQLPSGIKPNLQSFENLSGILGNDYEKLIRKDLHPGKKGSRHIREDTTIPVVEEKTDEYGKKDTRFSFDPNNQYNEPAPGKVENTEKENLTYRFYTEVTQYTNEGGEPVDYVKVPNSFYKTKTGKKSKGKYTKQPALKEVKETKGKVKIEPKKSLEQQYKESCLALKVQLTTFCLNYTREGKRPLSLNRVTSLYNTLKKRENYNAFENHNASDDQARWLQSDARAIWNEIVEQRTCRTKDELLKDTYNLANLVNESIKPDKMNLIPQIEEKILYYRFLNHRIHGGELKKQNIHIPSSRVIDVLYTIFKRNEILDSEKTQITQEMLDITKQKSEFIEELQKSYNRIKSGSGRLFSSGDLKLTAINRIIGLILDAPPEQTLADILKGIENKKLKNEEREVTLQQCMVCDKKDTYEYKDKDGHFQTITTDKTPLTVGMLIGLRRGKGWTNKVTLREDWNKLCIKFEIDSTDSLDLGPRITTASEEKSSTDTEYSDIGAFAKH